MKKLVLVLGLVMSLVSCSGDSMDIPPQEENQWWFTATEYTNTLYKYNDGTSRTNVTDSIVFEVSGISFKEVQRLKEVHALNSYVDEDGTTCKPEGYIQVGKCFDYTVTKRVIVKYNALK